MFLSRSPAAECAGPELGRPAAERASAADVERASKRASAADMERTSRSYSPTFVAAAFLGAAIAGGCASHLLRSAPTFAGGAAHVGRCRFLPTPAWRPSRRLCARALVHEVVYEK